MRAVYEAIKTRLETITGIQRVSWWNNQLISEEQGDEMGFNRPACFIEFIQIPEWSTRGDNEKYMEDLRIRIHSITDSLERENVDFFDLRDSVIEKLDGYEVTDLIDKIRLIGETPPHDFSNQRDYQIDFTLNIYDLSFIKSQNYVNATVDTLTITKELDIDNQIIRTGDGTFD